MKTNKAFTLLELLVVLTIIAIIASIVCGAVYKADPGYQEQYEPVYDNPDPVNVQQEQVNQLKRQNDLLEEQIRLKRQELERATK